MFFSTMELGECRLDQPDSFQLEMDLLRWIKLALRRPNNAAMVRPAGPVTEKFGLDSGSR